MIHVEKLGELPGHQNPIFTAEPSQKPGILFTAGNDKGVVEWSLARREFIKVMFPVKSSVYALHATPGLPYLIAGERSGDATVFSFDERRIIATLSHHKLPVFDVRSVPSKNELLLASEDGTVSVWRPGSFERMYTFPVSPDTVRVMAVSPDEKQVAFGSKDNRIRIFSLDDYTLIAQLRDHTLPVTALQYSPDGKYLLSGSRDASLKVWNTLDFSLHQSISAHLFTLYDIRYHPTLPLVATASRDKSIKIWSAHDFRLRKIISREKGFAGHRLSINKICWDPQEHTLISVGDDKLVMIWRIEERDENGDDPEPAP